MWWHQDWTMWNWFFMALSMALFWAVLIGAVVWALRSSGRAGSEAPARRPTARDTLDERFARGEIGEDEYRRARKALSSDR